MDKKTQQRAQTLPERLHVPTIEISVCKSLSFKDKIKASLNKPKKIKKEEVDYGRIVVLGDTGVGKSSIIMHFVKNIFTAYYTPTSSVAIFDAKAVVECKKAKQKSLSLADSLRKVTMLRTKSANLPREKNEIAGLTRTVSFGKTPIDLEGNKENVKNLKEFHFQLVDTPGDISTSSPISYRATIGEANGYLLVCSYDKPDSLDYLRNVINDIKNINHNKTVPIIIVINKSDLSSEETDYFGDKVAEMAKEMYLQWSEISTSKKEGFKTMTENITREMNLYQQVEEEQNSKMLGDEFWH